MPVAAPGEGTRPRVAVIIPAYNAATTIARTLDSVRAQTLREIEVIVVDDGSSDATRDIVLRYADADHRIRLLQQPNQGVAAARNCGIRESTAAFIAPVDADDLWHARKLEEQLAAMLRGGDEVGLVYTWSVTINAADEVVGFDHNADENGYVVEAMCRRNFLGNGSCALMRRQAVLQAGGYDPALRASNAGGCEDWDLYLRIAARWAVAAVPAYLTGYRVVAGNMSSQCATMWRSHRFVAERAARMFPELAPLLAESDLPMLNWLVKRAVSTGSLSVAGDLFSILLGKSRRVSLQTIGQLPVYLLRSWMHPRIRSQLKALAGRGSRSNGDVVMGAPFPIGTSSHVLANIIDAHSTSRRRA